MATDVFFGLTQGATPHLVEFTASTLGSPTDLGAVTGLNAGDTLVALTTDPSTELVYGLAVNSSANAEIYGINTTTAAATPVVSTTSGGFAASAPVGFTAITPQGPWLFETWATAGPYSEMYGLDGSNTAYYTPSIAMPIAAAQAGSSVYGLDSSGNLLAVSDYKTTSTIASTGTWDTTVGLQLAGTAGGKLYLTGVSGGNDGLYTVDTSTGTTTLVGTLSQALMSFTEVTVPDTLKVTGIPSPMVAGTQETVTVQAYDASGNPDPNYNGTVAISSTDSNAAFSGLATGDLTLVNGMGTFQATLKTAGTQSVTATDTSDAKVSGSETNITVTPGAASQFVVVAPATTQAGAWQTFTVRAADAFGNTVDGYANEVHFASTDPSAILPLDVTLTNGTGSFSFVLSTAGIGTISANQAGDPTIAGTSSNVGVIPGAAVRLALSASTSTTLVGSAVAYTVTALDNYGNTAVGDSDRINLAATAPGAYLPSSVTLAGGVATFTAAFATPGANAVTASDATTAAVAGASAGVDVGQIVQGFVFQDLTGSGLYAVGDPALSGRVLFLDLQGTGRFATGDPTTTTGAGGFYAFRGYAAGSHPVLEETSQDASNMVVVDQFSTATDGGVDISVVPISPVAPVPVVPNPFGPMTAASFDSAYVQSLYRAVLGRDGSAQDVAGWARAMQAGLTPAAVAQGFVNSVEHRTDEVNSYYEQYLGHAADATATAWVNDLLGGMSEEQVVEGIIGSAAYQANYATDAAFVAGLYVNVLGRQGDPQGLSDWTNALTSGTLTRAQAAADFVQAEAVGQILGGLYVAYLRRQPDPMSVGWANYLQGGGSVSVVAEGLLTSSGYLADARALAPVSPSWMSSVARPAGAVPPTAVSAPDWYAANLLEPQLASLVRQDMATDGQVTRADVLALFSAVEGNGAITSAEYQDLQTIVGNTSVIVMTPAVRNLATKTVGSSLANQSYQDEALGNLAIGSPASQLQDLVDKWFLGLDRPITSYTYATPGGTLFGNGGGVGYTQINQGLLGDCYFLSSLGSIAQHDPQAIRNLITANGDGTYTVEFYANINGTLTPDYVTVDGMLPESGGEFIFDGGYVPFDGASNVLWSSYVEKAYAQWTAEGYNTQIPKTLRINSYLPIGDGYVSAQDALRQLTGDPAYVATTPDKVTFAQIAAAFDAGTSVICGTDDTPPPPDSSVVDNHDYALIGYNSTAQTLTLFSPWGLSGGYDKRVFKPGLITLTMSEFDANYSDVYLVGGMIPV